MPVSAYQAVSGTLFAISAALLEAKGRAALVVADEIFAEDPMRKYTRPLNGTGVEEELNMPLAAYHPACGVRSS